MPAEETPGEIPSTGPHVFNMQKWISTAPFEELLNMDIVEAENGEALLTMPFYRDYANGAGLMHGGALVALADTAVVMAIKSMIDPYSHFATTAMETRFLAPMKKGIATARAKVTDRDGRVMKGVASVEDEDGRIVMELTSTFKLARDAKLRGITFEDA